MNPTFAGRFTLSLIDVAATKGARRGELIASTGLSEEELGREEQRVDGTIYNQVVEMAVEQTGDPLFGLHAGEHLSLSAAGLIGQITQTSSSVKEALDYCCEFASLGCRALPMKLDLQGEFYRLAFIPDRRWLAASPESVRQTIDGTLAFTIREYHALTRQKSYPAKITLNFPRPERSAEYERVLNAPLQFGADETAITFRQDQVDQPVVTSDYHLLRLLVAHAEAKLATIEGEEGFRAVVERTILSLAEPGMADIESVARNLNTTKRTLQRRLAEEGETFSNLLDKLRKESALGYLRNREITLNETASLLGYADTSTFLRSFKRWTGMTPGAYRQSEARA